MCADSSLALTALFNHIETGVRDVVIFKFVFFTITISQALDSSGCLTLVREGANKNRMILWRYEGNSVKSERGGHHRDGTKIEVPKIDELIGDYLY